MKLRALSDLLPDPLWQHGRVFARPILLTALSLLAIACAGGETDQAIVVDVDWSPKVEATRTLNPVGIELFLSVEVNEELEAGHLISGRIDFQDALADLTNFAPLSSSPRNRVIVNGTDAYLITAIDAVIGPLPEGAEIIAGSVSEFQEMGILPMDPTVIFGALGLLGGSVETRQTDPTTFEVDLDPVAAMAGLSAAERRSVPLDLGNVTDNFGFAEVTLSPDGSTIERFRVRISGTSEDRDVLMTIDYRLNAVETELTFDPPPPDSVVDLSEYPEIRQSIIDLGPGF